jgi:carboxymethylenebutenolidase
VSALRRALILGAIWLFPLAQAQAETGVGPTKIELASGGEPGSGLVYENLGKAFARGRHPAIVLIPEWWGVNDFVKKKAAAFAEAGYVALVVDLYRGQVASDADTAHQLSRGLPRDRALRDLRASLDALGKRPDVDPARIGVVGWCMGGGYAIELAANEPRVHATVAYYGSILTDGATVKKIKAPFLGNYGADDKGIAANDVRAFAAALTAQGTSADVKIYPNAGHAFASSDKPEVFKKDAAADADARTSAFFAKSLKP